LAGSSESKRDPRIDFLRGAALLTIFVDHVPGNFLATLTVRNFGFSDAAELFVLLAGFSAMIAYGRVFEQAGAGMGLRRVGARCLRIYLVQVSLLLTTLAIVQFWISNFGLEPGKIRPLLHGVAGVAHGLVLHALPASLNILPLYIVLLAIFPLLWLGVRHCPAPTLAASGLLWLGANLYPGINLPNWMDGQGWFFNPFAWQFLFAIGVLCARIYNGHGRSLPVAPSLRLACVAYLAFALLAAAPWTNWGFGSSLFDFDLNKTNLSPLRLINVLAFAYVAMCSPWFARLVRWRGLQFITTCGRHSLEVFAVGTLIALIGRLSFRTFGITLGTQALVTCLGFGAMIGAALLLDRPQPLAAARRALLPGWR
jgi:hypothetical protein